MPVVFISYRRSDSEDVTGRIYDRLVSRFTKQRVFKDVDNIPLGVSFPLHIQQMLGKANVALVVIGPNWLSATDEQGRRRLDDPNDFVRLEIETALRAEMPVIPILVAKAQMPLATKLPASIKSLTSRNGMAVRADPDFNRDMDRLFSGIAHIERLIEAQTRRAGDGKTVLVALTPPPEDEPIIVANAFREARPPRSGSRTALGRIGSALLVASVAAILLFGLIAAWRFTRTPESKLAEPNGGNPTAQAGAKVPKGEFSKDVLEKNGKQQAELPVYKEPDKKGPDKKEPEKKEPDKKEPDKKEPDKKESDKKESDKKESDKKEPDKKEPDKIATAPVKPSDLPTGEGMSWVGKTVLLKQNDTKIFPASDAAKQAHVATLDQMYYRVLAEQGDMINVKTRHGTVGWLAKADALLPGAAVEYFGERIRQNLNDANGYAKRAVAWELQSHLEKAIEDHGEAIRLAPHANRYVSRGLVWQAKKDYEAAMADYNEAIRLDAKNVYAFCNRASAWMQKKDPDRAISDYGEAIRIDPQYAFAFRERGNAWSWKKDYEKAVADYTEAIRLDPRDSFALNGRGNAWSHKKDYDKAIADFSESIHLNPKDSFAFNERGNAWSHKKDYDKAILDFSESIRLDPRDAFAFNERGVAWYYKMDYKKAIADYTEAIKLDPHPTYYQNRANALRAAGSDAEALRDEEKAKALSKP